MSFDSDYTGYVSIGTPLNDQVEWGAVQFGYIRPHPTIHGVRILSYVWTSDTGPSLYPVDPDTRAFTIRGANGTYVVDLMARTCTCAWFLYGHGRTPIHRRSCKHLERLQLTQITYDRDVVTYVARDRVAIQFQLFGNSVPRRFFSSDHTKWCWSIKYDGIRVCVDHNGYGITNNGLCIDLRTVLPAEWGTIVHNACGLLNEPYTVFDAELLPEHPRTCDNAGHNMTMNILSRNTVNGLRLKVFDIMAAQYTFAQRYDVLCTVFRHHDHYVVKQHDLPAHNTGTLQHTLTTLLEQGHEGIIVRKQNQDYAFGQRISTHAFKAKSQTTFSPVGLTS